MFICFSFVIFMLLLHTSYEGVARYPPKEKKKPVGMIDRNDINLNPPEPNKY